MYVEQNQTHGNAAIAGDSVNDAGPALAMVYSPRQYWRMTYTPAEALDKGTLFEELWKPLSGVCPEEGGNPG